MSDTPTNGAVPATNGATPAAAPAAAPAASPAVAQRFASDDMLIEHMVRGKRVVVPVGVAKADIGLGAASREMIEEAKAIERKAHADRADAEQLRALRRAITTTTPDEARREVERMMGVRLSSSDDTDPVDARPAPRQPNTTDVEERLKRVEAAQHQGALQSQLSTVLDSFDLFKQDEATRGAARDRILARMVIDPSSDPLDVARDFYTEEVDRRSKALTAQRDTRTERAANLPNLPLGVGTPDLSDIPAGKASDAKDGTLRKNILTAIGRYRSMATGQT